LATGELIEIRMNIATPRRDPQVPGAIGK